MTTAVVSYTAVYMSISMKLRKTILNRSFDKLLRSNYCAKRILLAVGIISILLQECVCLPRCDSTEMVLTTRRSREVEIAVTEGQRWENGAVLATCTF